MKKIILVLVSFYILLLSLVSFSIAGGQHLGVTSLKDFKVRAINIFGRRSGDVMKEMKLEPFNEIFVDRGTRVSWTNQSDTPIRIKFKKGEICRNISKNPQSPQHWLPDECYITKDPIPPRGILELYFNERDDYDYVIEFVGTESILKAKLVVN